MIAVAQCQSSSTPHAEFLALLPEITARLRVAFRSQDAAARDEATADGIALCLVAYLRLHTRGRAKAITASNLAWYAIKQLRSGRSAGCRLNSREPLAAYAQRRHGFCAVANVPDERLWIDALAAGRRCSVLDQVAARLDVAAWLSTLPQRTREIAVDLAQGSTTSEVARKQGVTAGRISQLRRELEASWLAFQSETAANTRSPRRRRS